MIVITQTPVRVSFLGGGTDYSEFFDSNKNGGQTLVTAINKFSYIKVSSLHDFFDYKYKVSYNKIEMVNSIEKIDHPSVKECLKFTDIQTPLEIHYMGDLPARTGLGSSSSFTVGLLNALHAYHGKFSNPKLLADEANEIEHNWIKERVGYQDQVIAAYGGFKHLIFNSINDIKVNTVTISSDRLKEFRSYLLIFYTGLTRTAHGILKEQIEKTKLGNNDSILNEMRILVDEAIDVLYSSNPLDDFGKILHESWKLKQDLSDAISNQKINETYNKALEAGATGGKLLGAGGGGFLLLFASPEKHENIRQKLTYIRELNFEFESSGTKIIFSQT